MLRFKTSFTSIFLLALFLLASSTLATGASNPSPASIAAAVKEQDQALSSKSIEKNVGSGSVARQSASEAADVITYQDKRLTDIWGVVQILAIVAGLLGALITIIVVFFSFKTEASAKAEARAQVEEWLKNHAPRMVADIIAPQAAGALKAIKDEATPILIALDAELNKTTKLAESIGASIINGGNGSQPDVGLEGAAQATMEANAELVLEPATATATAEVQPKPEHPLRPAFEKAVKLARAESWAEAVAAFQVIIDDLRQSKSPQDQALSLEAQVELAKIHLEIDQPEHALNVLEKAIAQVTEREDPTLIKLLAKAYYQLARAMEELGNLAGAIEATAETVRLSQSIAPEELDTKVRALNLRARCLFDVKQYADALATNEEALATLERAPEKITRGLPATSRAIRLRKAQLLIELGRRDEAKTFLRSYLEKFAGDKPATFSKTARERLLLATIYEDEGSYYEALGNLDEVERSFKNILIDGDILMQALLKKAAILSRLSRTNDEVKVYDQIVEHFEATAQRPYTSKKLAKYAITAQVNKAITLSESKQVQEALAIVTAVVEKYRENRDKTVIEQVAKAARLKNLLER